MTEPTELLPCPFCGSKAFASVSKGESLWSHNIVDWTRVHCTNDDCNAQTEPTCEGYEPSAIEVWNRRTPQPTQAQAGAVPQCYQSGSLMSAPDGGMTAHLHFNGSDGVEAWFDAITDELAARSIKGGQHGAE